MRYSLKLFLPALLLATAALAQVPGRQQPTPPNSLAVKVSVAGMSHLPGLAKLTLSKGDMPIEDKYCDIKGEYQFNGLPDGEYTVLVSLPGYAEETRPIFLRGGNTGQLSFMLRPERAASTPLPKETLVDARWLAAPEAARNELMKGRDLRRQGNFKGSIQHLQRALELHPDFVFVYSELGLTQWAAGDKKQAEEAFQNGIRVAPDLLPSYLALADMLAQDKEFPRASGVLAKASQAQPRSPEPFIAIARMQLTTGHPDKAEQACKLAVARGNPPDAQLLLANIYMRTGDKPKAIAALEAYLQLAPEGDQAEQVRKNLEALKK